tara:strand:+ start:21 stop:677 length:657 start_codon:yes stop_codon:yes gene_type:complete
MKFSTLVLIVALAVSGCKSFSSTMLNRLDDNSFMGNSNGQTMHNGKTRPYKGIPITLEVPSHLDIYIDEIYYMNMNNGSEASDPYRMLNVRATIIKTDKVFTVDFKRPGAGTLDLNLDFDANEQYFKKITSKIEDETIEQIGTSLSSFINTIQGQKTSASPDDINLLQANGFLRDERTVAYRRFDINSPSFECEVEEFVNHHLNNCNVCGTMPTYDQN